MGKKYKHPPIIEAFCEFQFEPNTSWIESFPGLIYTKIEKSFPKQRPAARLNVGLAATPVVLRQELGVLPIVQFLQEDEKALVQIGQHLLAVNRLKPYISWADFLPLIEQALQAYREVAEPASIHRIGLRYINRIELSAELVQFDKYFEFYPYIGAPLLGEYHHPEGIQALIAGIQFSYNQSRDSLRVQLTTTTSDSPDTLALLLDLDYSLAEPGTIALDDLIQWIQLAHERIEEVFEACIKDPLKQMFEEAKESDATPDAIP